MSLYVVMVLARKSSLREGYSVGDLTLHPLDAFEAARRAVTDECTLPRLQVKELIKEHDGNNRALLGAYLEALANIIPREKFEEVMPQVEPGFISWQVLKERVKLIILIDPLLFTVRGERSPKRVGLALSWLAQNPVTFPRNAPSDLLSEVVAVLMAAGLRLPEVVEYSPLGEAEVREAWEAALQRGREILVPRVKTAQNAEPRFWRRAYETALTV